MVVVSPPENFRRAFSRSLLLLISVSPSLVIMVHHLHAGLLRRAARVHRFYPGACRQIVLLGHIGVHLPDIHAQRRAVDITQFHQVVGDVHGVVNGDGEANALDAGAGGGGAGILGAGHAHHLACILNSGRGVAWNDGRVWFESCWWLLPSVVMERFLALT